MPTIEIDDKTYGFLEELQSKFDMTGHSVVEFHSNVVRHGILSVSKMEGVKEPIFGG